MTVFGKPQEFTKLVQIYRSIFFFITFIIIFLTTAIVCCKGASVMTGWGNTDSHTHNAQKKEAEKGRKEAEKEGRKEDSELKV